MFYYKDLKPPSGPRLAALFVGVILALLFFELVVGNYFEAKKEVIFEGCYRTTETGSTMAPFIEHIALQSNGEKPIVVVIGSSLAQGSAVSSNETVACFLQRLLPNARVYNLAKSASLITDDYLVFTAVRKYADVIILNANYANFLEFEDWSPGFARVRYAEFAFLPNVYDSDSEGMAVQPHSSKKLEYVMDSIAKFSALYRNRQIIQEAIFGSSPKDLPLSIFRKAQCVVLNQCIVPSFASFSALDPVVQTKILAAPEIRSRAVANISAPPVYYVRKMAVSGNNVIIYINPVNPAVELTGTNYSVNIQLLQQASESFSSDFVDLTAASSFSPEDFADALHMLASGNRKTAEALYPIVVNRLNNSYSKNV